MEGAGRADNRAVGPSHPQVKFKVTQPWSSKLTAHQTPDLAMETVGVAVMVAEKVMVR